MDQRDQGSTAVEIVQHRPGQAPSARQDAVATEEPIALRVDGAEWTVVMRTPGHDLELAVGLLWADLHLATELVLLFGGMSMGACWWLTLALPEPREEKALIDRERRSPDSIRATILKPIFPNLIHLWRRGA